MIYRLAGRRWVVSLALPTAKSSPPEIRQKGSSSLWWSLVSFNVVSQYKDRVNFFRWIWPRKINPYQRTFSNKSLSWPWVARCRSKSEFRFFSFKYFNKILKIKQTVCIESSTVEIEERGVRLRLTVVDTPGYGDAIDNRECYKPILDYIDTQFEQYLHDESGLNRRNISDHRVHCCFYFISPTGHGLKVSILFWRNRHYDVIISHSILSSSKVYTIALTSSRLSPRPTHWQRRRFLDSRNACSRKSQNTTSKSINYPMSRRTRKKIIKNRHAFSRYCNLKIFFVLFFYLEKIQKLKKTLF